MAGYLRAGPGAARGWLPAVAALALACVALAGCGHAVATDTTGPAGTGVCANAGQVDRLTIDRVSSFPQNHLHFSFPAQVTATSPHQAQAVARALCALPPMPHGPMSCPGDWGVSYRLHFATSRGGLSPVKVDPGGCQEVYGLAPARWIARSPAFWGHPRQGGGHRSRQRCNIRRPPPLPDHAARPPGARSDSTVHTNQHKILIHPRRRWGLETVKRL